MPRFLFYSMVTGLIHTEIKFPCTDKDNRSTPNLHWSKPSMVPPIAPVPCQWFFAWNGACPMQPLQKKCGFVEISI